MIQLPDELIEELQQIAWEDEKNKYKVGDIAHELCTAYKNDDVYKEIGKWTNKSKHTIRGYREIAEFWTYQLRVRYEQISWSHVKAFKGAAEGDSLYEKRAHACELINECLKDHDPWGGVPSVDGVRVWLYKRDPVPLWEQLWARMVTIADKLLKLEDAPAWVSKLAHAVKDAKG